MIKKSLLVVFLFASIVLRAQHVFYGTTAYGGAHNDGTIFKYDPYTNKQTVVFSFNGTNGNEPECKLLYVADSLLFGMTNLGGANNMGTAFRFNIKTNVETVIVNYDSTNGYLSTGANEFMQATNGLLYGTSSAGGKHGAGVLYSYDIHTNKDSVLYNFDTLISGIGPDRSLWEDTTTKILYGTTASWGKLEGGVLHGYNILTNKDSTYVNFKFYDTNPWEPISGLMHANNGLLYGMSAGGGTGDSGTIYSYDIGSNSMNMVFQFHHLSGYYPNGNGLIQLPNGLLYGMTTQGGSAQYGVVFSFNPVTNSQKVLVDFDRTNNGADPQGSVTYDPDNSLIYGMTGIGGSNDDGIIFSYDTATSTYTKLLDFNGINGAGPVGSLTLVDTLGSTGVNNIIAKADIRAYPNPNNGKFTIAMQNVSEKYSIEIYNILGENIYQGTLNFGNSQINLNDQPMGVYLYRILSEDGGFIGSGKLVIQH